METIGTLYVVATPLGNLKDITLRALEVLRESDLIAAEDTRRTQKLLAAYDLHVPLTSYHENNKARKGPYLIEKLKAGTRISLVTDGGTPAISDPGRDLVQEARQAQIPIIPIPGPSALTCALSASGLPADSFLFLGFLPRRRSRRKRILREVKGSSRTVVLFEAPHRILTLLREILEILGDVQALMARELTKIHEEFLYEPVSRLIERGSPKRIQGEITLILPPFSEPENPPEELEKEPPNY